MSRLDACVGISVSSPGERELEARGLIEDHVRHAFVEIARQILAAGGSLAYGGDLRHAGYTRTLISLLRTYSRADRPARVRVSQYLARPVWEALTVDDEAELALLTTPVRVPGPTDTNQRGRAGRAADFTAMRERMTARSNARIVVGGRLAGQQGRWPGIVEEAYLALRESQPLFVVGGLGGAAARLADALRGEWPTELTTDIQSAMTEGYGELLEAGVGPDEDALRAVLLDAKLANGLGEEDNELLLRSRDLDLVIALVLRGLWTASTTQESSDSEGLG